MACIKRLFPPIVSTTCPWSILLEYKLQKNWPVRWNYIRNKPVLQQFYNSKEWLLLSIRKQQATLSEKGSLLQRVNKGHGMWVVIGRFQFILCVSVSQGLIIVTCDPMIDSSKKRICVSWLINFRVHKLFSDFVTNSYGESWDSSFEKSWVPFQKCLGLYVTRQLIWRQTPKLWITVHWIKI